MGGGAAWLAALVGGEERVVMETGAGRRLGCRQPRRAAHGIQLRLGNFGIPTMTPMMNRKSLCGGYLQFVPNSENIQQGNNQLQENGKGGV